MTGKRRSKGSWFLVACAEMGGGVQKQVLGSGCVCGTELRQDWPLPPAGWSSWCSSV